jgi:hypothetical protein
MRKLYAAVFALILGGVLYASDFTTSCQDPVPCAPTGCMNPK